MASQTVVGHWLPAHLVAYRNRYPGIRLDVRMGNTDAVADAVAAGLVEIGLVEGRVDRATLSSRVVATDEMIVVAAPDHPWSDGRAVTADRLAETAWVLREPGSGTRLAFNSLIAKAGIDYLLSRVARFDKRANVRPQSSAAG